jgi:arylsulfatase A-like enzyme
MSSRPTPIQVGLTLLSLVAGACASTDAHTESATPPPNIVFFLVDDQTSSVLGCYGNSLARTPNIDRLAARGIRFSNAFVNQSICWVSRTTLLTGVTGRGYGSPGDPELTRPEIARELTSDHLRSAGYRTGFFGKWHAKMPAGYKPSDHFDEFEAIHRDPYWKRLPDGSLRHETDLIVDRGLEFLGRRDRDRPFALHLWFNACHAEDGDCRPAVGLYPWPDSVSDLFSDTVMPRPLLDAPAVFDALPEFLRTTIPRERWFWGLNTEWKYQQNMRAYYRMVSGIDHAIGR